MGRGSNLLYQNKSLVTASFLGAELDLKSKSIPFLPRFSSQELDNYNSQLANFSKTVVRVNGDNPTLWTGTQNWAIKREKFMLNKKTNQQLEAWQTSFLERSQGFELIDSRFIENFINAVENDKNILPVMFNVSNNKTVVYPVDDKQQGFLGKTSIREVNAQAVASVQQGLGEIKGEWKLVGEQSFLGYFSRRGKILGFVMMES